MIDLLQLLHYLFLVIIFYSSLDSKIKLWDINSGNLIKTLQVHESGVSSVTFSSDGKTIVSGGEDSTVRLWNVKSNKEIIKMISFSNGEWIVMTPDGYFNSSPNATEFINVRSEYTIYPISDFYDRFFDPEYIQSVLQKNSLILLTLQIYSISYM